MTFFGADFSSAGKTPKFKTMAHSAKKKIIFALSVLFLSRVFASDVTQERLVRFSLWAQMDVYPGYFEGDTASESVREINRQNDGDDVYSVPVRKIREVAPFFVGGMVYGWKFEYTPYDKARGVEEFFEFSPVFGLSDADKERIRYAKPWVKDDVLSAWVEFPRTEEQMHFYYFWRSVIHPRVSGIGYAPLSDGFDGIKSASEEALRNAVREYARKKIKTKPKLVSGTVLISEPALIGIDAGRYRVSLDFFMETDRILEYKTF